MSITVPSSLLDKIEQHAELMHHRDVLVPVEDVTAFMVLVTEMAGIAVEEGGNDLTVLTDSRTAAEVHAVTAACGAAQHVFIFGDPPDSLSKIPGLSACDPSEILDTGDRLFLAISSTLSFIVIGHEQTVEDLTDVQLKGRWTGIRTFVRYMAELMLDLVEKTLPLDISTPPDTDITQACNLRLMSIMTRHHASEHRSAVMATSDLSSVLEILKAVSVRRRTHDILYLFVEKIANTVGIDRCSIVRVWGGENHGHVLVSHEDQAIRDVVIQLDKHPEIVRSMSTGSKVVINNVANNPLTKPFSNELEAAGVTAILVVPIVLYDEHVGSFFLRAVQKGGMFYRRDVNFCEIVAKSAANALERAHLFESIQTANQRLEHLAITDELTGLYNYRHFRNRLEEEYDRASRYNIPLACMLIDVDDFKKINDTFGHLQGDSVLREIAERARNGTRKNDILARYGGEELVAIMPQTEIDGAMREAERLLEEVRRHPYDGMPDNY
ncbi:MAG: sensor domain-containing diguanylate cyclase, partial [Candidatus Hydrogenedentes bacterium]|nr:sensor domain-containing diguanylate cyclase [Candidatus Hydrogenedentota bacterium]